MVRNMVDVQAAIIHGVCYVAGCIALFAAIAERDVLEWIGVAISAGACIFSWGLGRYHDFRRQLRQEDSEDRRTMLEDIRAQSRILYEMESRQLALQKSIECLSVDVDKEKCKYPKTNHVSGHENE